MITIRIKPARRMFGGRKQWKFEIVGANGKRIDPRDTYANPADIQAIMRRLCCISGDTVQLESHDPITGSVFREQLR